MAGKRKCLSLHLPAISVLSSLLPCALQSSWVPRRGDQGPKTIDQIHKEAEMEEHREHIKVQQLMSKDKRRGPPGPSSSGECLGLGALEFARGGILLLDSAQGWSAPYDCPSYAQGAVAWLQMMAGTRCPSARATGPLTPAG